MNESTELTEIKRPNKFRNLLRKIGKRNLIIAAAVLLIGAAVTLNWVLFSGSGDDPGYPYDQQSGNQIDDTQGNDTKQTVNENDTYFSATQVSRQRARDEALEVLQSVVDNIDASDTDKAAALAGITDLSEEIRKESDIESILTAKGFTRCVAVLNGDTANIIVESGKTELQRTDLAQINAVVYDVTGIEPVGVTIVNK